MRDLRQPDLGVAHRRGVVAVDRAEVALAVDQHVAQREVLRHAHDRVVDRRVAVRVVLADHVADDARRLLVGPVPVVVQLVHREQHAPVHRLQAVARIGQGAADDHAHRVVEVRPPHLLFEADGQGFLGELRSCGVRSERGRDAGRCERGARGVDSKLAAACRAAQQRRPQRRRTGQNPVEQSPMAQSARSVVSARCEHGGLPVLSASGLDVSQDITAAFLERRIMKKLNKVACFSHPPRSPPRSSCAALMAQTVDNWVAADGTPWKNGTNELCWRDGFWTPATACRAATARSSRRRRRLRRRLRAAAARACTGPAPAPAPAAGARAAAGPGQREGHLRRRRVLRLRQVGAQARRPGQAGRPGQQDQGHQPGSHHRRRPHRLGRHAMPTTRSCRCVVPKPSRPSW